jgi:PST family polysaccharide transporter
MQFVSNSIFLYVLHFGNYLYPFFLTPVLAGSLGVEVFGHFSYFLSIAQIGLLVADYGFNYSGVQRIAQTRHSRDLLSETFFSITFSKILFIFVMLLAMLISNEVVGQKMLVLVWFLPFAIGSALTPQWYFIGLEKSGILAICTVLPKLVAIPIMIVALQKHATAEFAALLFGIPVVLSAVVLNYIIWRSGALKMVPPRISAIKERLHEGWYVFLSQLSTILYTTLNPVIMFFLLDAKAVGYFVVADKIRMAFQSMVSPVVQAANSRLSAMRLEDVDAANALARKLIAIIFVASCIGTLCLFLLSKHIILWMFGAEYGPSAGVLTALCGVIPVVTVGSSVGLLLVMPNGGGRFFAITVVVAGLVNLLILAFSASSIQVYSAALSIGVAESFIAVSFLCYAKKYIK